MKDDCQLMEGQQTIVQEGMLQNPGPQNLGEAGITRAQIGQMRACLEAG